MSKKDRLSSLEKRIIEILKSYPDASIPIPLLMDALSLPKKGEKKIKKAVNRLKQLDHVFVTKGNLVRLNEAAEEDDNVYTGTLDVTSHGDGYVIVEGRDQDIKISQRFMGTALNGDTVKVKLTGYHKKSNKPMGKIEEVEERADSLLVGTLKEVAKNTYLIETDHQSSRVDFFVDPKDMNDAKPGDKVTFRLIQWEDVRGYPQAKIQKTFGPAGSNEANVLSILAEKQFESSFPPEVEKFAEEIPEKIPEDEIKRRRDMREEVVLTIDPADAKDFDDGLSIEILDNGNYYLGVHIADVSHYMPRSTVLDDEAIERGTSVYLVDRVIPMLPECLSNGVCSLRPHEDKLAYSCFMEIAPNGKLVDYSIEETVIHSKQRFTYDDAQLIIDGGTQDHPLKDDVLLAAKLARTLTKKRKRQGSIDFDTDEVKVVLNEKGVPVDIVRKERMEANRLVEELMLLANQTIASHIGKKKEAKAFVYRIHDRPDAEKIKALRDYVKAFGYQLPTGPDGSVDRKDLNELIEHVKGMPEGPV